MEIWSQLASSQA